MTTDAVPFAYYLPQYHPTPENDEFWGTGFTEWSTVSKARPLFRGHEQPHRPADLGFYDLRVPATRAHQADLAAAAGLAGFALYHYWSLGRRLLHEPVDGFFTDPPGPLGYLLCWANESWTLEWRGQDHHVTISQDYSRADDVAHAEFLTERYFTNPRYFRHEGRPVFLIYHPRDLPDPHRTVATLRDVARSAGVELLLGGCAVYDEGDPRSFGLDFGVRWAPAWVDGMPPMDRWRSELVRLRHRAPFGRHPAHRGVQLFDYRKAMAKHLSRPRREWPTCESLFPSWDNTARRQHGEAVIFRGSSPARFEEWLRATCDRRRPDDPPFVFINAWNEWAEGCHLEPCERHGHAWLDVCLRTFRGPAS